MYYCDSLFYGCSIQAGNLHTQTNTEESECDTGQDISKQRRKLRQNNQLVPKRGATSVTLDIVLLWKKTTHTQDRKLYSDPKNTTNIFIHLHKNHAKPYGQSLWMKPTMVLQVLITNPTLRCCKRLLSAQHHNAKRWKEITAAVVSYKCK